MILVKEYLSDNPSGFGPSDDEIKECLNIVQKENCIVKLKWYVNYSGWYTLTVKNGMTFDDCENALPKVYPM